MDSSTLRYGTADAARTVHNDDAELERKLEATAKKLNLRTHLVHGVVCVCVERERKDVRRVRNRKYLIGDKRLGGEGPAWGSYKGRESVREKGGKKSREREMIFFYFFLIYMVEKKPVVT